MDLKKLGDQIAFSADKLKKLNLFLTERLCLDVYGLRPGQEQTPHAHADSDKVYVVLEGRCVFCIDGETVEEGPGAVVLARAGRVHGVRNPGPADARLLVAMTPPPAGAKSGG